MGRPKAKQPDPPTQQEQEAEHAGDLERCGDTDIIPPTPQTAQVDKLDLILKEIRDTRSALETQIRTLSVGLNLLQADHKKLAEKVKSQKMALDDLIPQQTIHSSQLEDMQRKITALQERIDGAEGRSRRNNVRILRIPEKSEGNNATGFVEQWLRTHVTTEGLTDHFSVERAHRLPPRPPAPGRPPRPLIARILDYKDRDTILRMARDKAPILFENRTVSLYPDFTLAVQKHVLRSLRSNGNYGYTT